MTTEPAGQTVSIAPVGWFNDILKALKVYDIQVVEKDGGMAVAHKRPIEELFNEIVNALIEQNVITTIVVPSNVSRLKKQVRELDDIIELAALDYQDKEQIEDIRDMIDQCAGNLDSAIKLIAASTGGC